MLGWANISRACFIDNGGLSDRTTCEYSKSAVKALHQGQEQLNNQRTWSSTHLVCSRILLEENEIWGLEKSGWGTQKTVNFEERSRILKRGGCKKKQVI